MRFEDGEILRKEFPIAILDWGLPYPVICVRKKVEKNQKDAIVDEFLKLMQVSKYRHSLSVILCDSIDKVDDASLGIARKVLENSAKDTNSTLLLYLGELNGVMKVLGGGLIGTKLEEMKEPGNRYLSKENSDSLKIVVASKAGLFPDIRGKGNGTKMINHILSVGKEYYNTEDRTEEPDAIIITTHVPEVRSILEKNLDYRWIGKKQRQALDDTLEELDIYISFPGCLSHVKDEVRHLHARYKQAWNSVLRYYTVPLVELYSLGGEVLNKDELESIYSEMKNLYENPKAYARDIKNAQAFRRTNDWDEENKCISPFDPIINHEDIELAHAYFKKNWNKPYSLPMLYRSTIKLLDDIKCYTPPSAKTLFGTCITSAAAIAHAD